MKKTLKKKFILSFLVFFVGAVFYTLSEFAFAQSATDNVVVTLDVTSGITISDGAPVTMAPNLGIAANSAIGSSAWTVITNSALGYTLAVKASSSPALVSGANSFADYTEGTPGTPEPWNTGSGSVEFGYSAFGTDTVTGTWGTGASCGAAGVPTATARYVGFTTTDKTIATRATVTPIAGVATTICFAAEQDTIFAASGTYTATITGTAVAL